ncbi:MAG: ABC transporter permease [candidate division Zixibacteria bacterium]|nr:ABC transporter permease [candidate division Zixibacteria bacterium]
MLRNYLLVALRNLYRNKLYSAIGVIGLSLGVTCCLLSFLYIRHELSFDRFHANGDNIYRLIQTESESHSSSAGSSSTSPMLREAVKTGISSVTQATLVTGSEHVVSRGAKSFTESVLSVDNDFLQMFSFELRGGDPATALLDPSSVVVTEDIAQKYFGSGDPIGETVTILLGETNVDLIVSAIIEAAPVTSSIQYDCLISASLLKHTIPEEVTQSWTNVLVSTYVQIPPGTDIGSLERAMSSHITGLASKDHPDLQLSFSLQPLADIHLEPRYEGESISSTDPIYHIVLSAIALAILTIASINFVTFGGTFQHSHARSRVAQSSGGSPRPTHETVLG